MESISALYDGETPPIEPGLVRAHLERCGTCRSYEQALASFRRSGVYRDPGPPAAGALRRRVAATDRASRPLVLRALLAFVAVEMAALALFPMFTSDDITSTSHPVRHLGAFTLAYAAVMLVTVLRPARAGVMIPVAVVLVGAVATNIALDVTTGTASLASQWTHLPELLSLPLLWLLRQPRMARTSSDPALPALELRPGASWTWARLRRVGSRRITPGSDTRLRAVGDEGQ